MPTETLSQSGASPTAPHERVTSTAAVAGNRGIKVVRAVTIRKPAAELYAFWRDVSNLPRIIHHSATVTPKSADESHWVVSAPGGHVEWDAVVINDKPGRLIAWRSKAGGDVDSAGSVRFEDGPGDEGTEVTVALEYDPPGGKIGALIAKFTRDSASSQVYDALKRFKALLEAGEIPTITGQSVGGPQGSRKGQS
jgi:uncharacterized membrane protein